MTFFRCGILYWKSTRPSSASSGYLETLFSIKSYHFYTQRQNHSNPASGWFFHEKVKSYQITSKCFFLRALVPISVQNWYVDSLHHVLMISATIFGEHQFTSKILSRAILVTKILKRPPDDEKSYKMTSYNVSDFIFGFYCQNYVRNVSSSFSNPFQQEFIRSEQCLPTKKIIEKMRISCPHDPTPRESVVYKRLGI